MKIGYVHRTMFDGIRSDLMLENGKMFYTCYYDKKTYYLDDYIDITPHIRCKNLMVVMSNQTPKEIKENKLIMTPVIFD
jgi:hypothetical protein